MTIDVVARAIKELNGSLEVVNNLLEIETYKYEADSYQAKWQWHLKQLILTHLAEFEEHRNHYLEGNYNLAESVEGWFCQSCNQRNDADTPCKVAELKAKRLMGEEL